MVKKILFILTIFLILLNVKVYAGEPNNIDYKALDNFSQKLQKDTDYMPDFSFSKMIETYRSTGSIGITAKDLVNSFCRSIFKEIIGNSKLLVELLFIGLLCAVLKNIHNAFSNDDVSNIAYYACYLVMIIIVIKSFVIAVQIGREAIDSMIQFMNSLMPSLIVLIASVGGFSQAATLDPVLMFTVKLISDIIRDLLLPMTILVVALNIVNNLSSNIKITKLVALFNQLTKWGLEFIITVFIGIITVRSSASATIDQVTMKTAKFAVDNFIPVVGKALSDAISTVAGYSLILKDALSIAGLIVMVFICIFPLIKIIIVALIYKFVGAVMEPVVDDRIVDCLTDVGNSLTMVFACVLSVGIMFFIMISIVASTGRLVMVG
jgi:stage III sporulation protein AE